MGLAEVQGALAKLYVDPTLRDRFFADPAAVGVRLGLDAEDALNLARIPRRQVEQFAESLRRKRREQVRRIIPITARALGREYAVLFERYVDESPPRGSKADLDDAAGFVAAIGRWPDRIEPAWAIDLARYELAWRQATRAGRIPIVRVFRFAIAGLATGREPEPVTRRATLALWWRPTRRGPIRHVVLAMPRLGVSLSGGRYR
jgi:hypothetical protein